MPKTQFPTIPFSLSLPLPQLYMIRTDHLPCLSKNLCDSATCIPPVVYDKCKWLCFTLMVITLFIFYLFLLIFHWLQHLSFVRMTGQTTCCSFIEYVYNKPWLVVETQYFLEIEHNLIVFFIFIQTLSDFLSYFVTTPNRS